MSMRAFRNSCNDSNTSTRIKEYFWRYPASTAKECCRTLGLSYETHGGKARKIKWGLKSWRGSIVPVTSDGRVLNFHLHRVEYCLKVPNDFVTRMSLKASDGRKYGSWYRSENRNKQIRYADDHVCIRVHRNGTCRILQRRIMSWEEVRVHVEDAFCKALSAKELLSETFNQMMLSLRVVERHRTFRIGPVNPFKLSFYRDSLGLDILADGSHPEHLEVRERWPTWVPVLFEHERTYDQIMQENTKVLADFTTQIQTHLDVMRGIGSVVKNLDQSVRSLAEAASQKRIQRML